MGWHGRSGAWEVIVIAQGERERGAVVTVLTNGTTWRWSCRDGHMMTLTEAADDALMERWFRTRGGEIGTGGGCDE
jgi:hypothetical protein